MPEHHIPLSQDFKDQRTAEEIHMIQECLEYDYLLTEWEIEFISIIAGVEYLSTRQHDKLRELHDGLG